MNFREQRMRHARATLLATIIIGLVAQRQSYGQTCAQYEPGKQQISPPSVPRSSPGTSISPTVNAQITKLGSNDPFKVVEAARALGGIGVGAAPALPALRSLLRDKPELVYADRNTGQVVDLFESLVRPEVVSAIVSIERSLTHEALAAKALAEDVDEHTKKEAALELSKRGDRRGIQPLIEALKSADKSQRYEIAIALSRLGSPEAVELLIEMLEDQDLELPTRRQAILALGKFGDKRSVALLVEILGDENSVLRSAATRALGDMGEKAIPDLTLALKTGNLWTRRGATQAMGTIRDWQVVQPLIDALADEDEGVRKSAHMSLVRITGVNFGQDARKWRQWLEALNTQSKTR